MPFQKGHGINNGRPKANHTLLAEKMRVEIVRRVHAELTPLLDAQIDAAKGIQTEQYNRSTGNLYYKDEGPNVNAFKILIEHAVGKPKESLELSGGMQMQLDIL